MEECKHIGKQTGFSRIRGEVVWSMRQCNSPRAEFDHCVVTTAEHSRLNQSKALCCETCPLYQGPNDPDPPPPEPVGTALKSIFDECGIEEPPGCSCKAWRMRMDAWGVEGCEKNRRLITEHLTHVSEKVQLSLWDKLRVAVACRATTVDGLLDEAIRRASVVASLPQG